MTSSGLALGRRCAGLAVGILVAGAGATSLAAVSVDAQACPELRPALLQDRLALELAAGGPRAPRGDVAIRFQCTPTAVRISTADGNLLREVRPLDANDADKERTIALAAAEALFVATPPSSAAGAAAPAAAARVHPGASVGADVNAFDEAFGPGVGAHGWMPLSLHTAIRGGAHVAWVERQQLGGTPVKAIIPELQLAISLRSAVVLPPGWPEGELRLFVAPALAFVTGAPPADQGERTWTITTGLGWSNFWRINRMLIGLDWDFGLTWPGPVAAFDVDHAWARRFTMRVALFVGFETGGG